MKKKIFGTIAVVAIAVMMAFNLNITTDTNEISVLTLNNLEALASGENGTPCGGPKTYGTCQSTNTVNCKDLSGCQ